MPVSFEEILNSRLFKFVVGEDADAKASEFSVHEDAVSQLSNPLYNLTKGNSIEARAGRARWKDVSKATFEKFIQFAYTGDYSIPKIEKRGTVAKLDKAETTIQPHPASPGVVNGIRESIGSPASDQTLVAEVNDKNIPLFDHVDRESVLENLEKLDDDSGSILNYPSTAGKKNRKKKRRQTVIEEARPEVAPEPANSDTAIQNHVQTEEEGVPKPETRPQALSDPAPVPEQDKHSEEVTHILVADFHSLSYPLLASRDNYEGTCEPSTDFNKENSYSNVLLTHASLYLLGDAQLVGTLKALALFKLHKTLSTFELDDNNIGDITDLARIAYSGEDKPLEEGIGGLRGLVCQYMAIHAVELSGDARFMNLLAGGGQIVKDFFKFQLQRIQ